VATFDIAALVAITGEDDVEEALLEVREAEAWVDVVNVVTWAVELELLEGAKVKEPVVLALETLETDDVVDTLEV